MLRKYFKWIFFLSIVINTLTCIAAEQKFTNHEGKAINFEDYKDKWQLFTYVSSECKYCRKEIAILNELINAYPDKLIVFGINNEGLTNDELNKFITEAKIKFTMLRQDPAALLHVKHVKMVPTTVIIKQNGSVLDPIVGFRSRKQLEEVLFKK
jgi:thiol-disulfide isomerase/thioredoxin